MTDTLPRISSRDQVAGRELVTRREIAHRLGYTQTSMATVMGRAPGRWPAPVAMIQMGQAMGVAVGLG